MTIAKTVGLTVVVERLKNEELSEDSKQAIETLARKLFSADHLTRSEANKLFKQAVEKMNVKVEKDLEIMTNIDRPDSFILPMTNRSTVRKCELEFIHCNYLGAKLRCSQTAR